MAKILIILFALACFQTCFSQKKCDVVYLNNGSIIRGKLTEQNDTVVKIMTCCGSIFAFRASEISRITNEKYSSAALGNSRKGYINFTTLGVLIGSTDNQKSAPFSALMEHTYRFNKNIALGGFMGFEQLKESLMPLGVNIKLFLPAGRSDFYLAGSGGYSVSLDTPGDYDIKKATGGVLFSTEIGLVMPISEGSALTLALGYRYNELNYKLNNYYLGDYTENITYNRFMVRFGISIF